MDVDDKHSHLNEGKHEPIPREKRNTLYINNLSIEATEEDVEFVFDKVLPDVKINSVRIVRDAEGNRKGICYVDV